MANNAIASISFDYNEEDSKLFDDAQKQHWKHIESLYPKLKNRILEQIYLPQTGTHKEWVKSRVDFHVSQSILRLLYLTEAFCDSSKQFNAVACASLIKSMTEIPLHLGYMVWILSNTHSFEGVQAELKKIAWGNRDAESGLTTSSKITHKELYTRADEVMKKTFKNDESTVNIFERLYKDSNAIGHHNYEARMLTGIQNKDKWSAGDRKELFVFFSNKIFQLFLYCDTILSMSDIFLSAADHYLKNIPDYYPAPNIDIGKQKFLEVKDLFKKLSDDMSNVVQSYYLWSALAFSRSIPVSGKELAEENVRIMNRYKYFFIQTEDSHMKAFIVGLSKFFDRNPRALSIQFILNKIDQYKDYITPEVLLAVYPNRFDKEDVINDYKPYDKNDTKEIEDLREKYTPIIQNLKTIRNKEVAHTDIGVIKGLIVPNEVEELIAAVQEMLNKISSRFDRSTTAWDHLQEQAINETKFLLKNLKRGEAQRVSEIKKDYE